MSLVPFCALGLVPMPRRLLLTRRRRCRCYFLARRRLPRQPAGRQALLSGVARSYSSVAVAWPPRQRHVRVPVAGRTACRNARRNV